MPVVPETKSKGGFALGDYVEVKDRIRMFYEAHPDGRLVTDRAEMWLEIDPPRVVVKALAYRTIDDPHPGVGWSWLTLPGRTPYTAGSELENAETSAWGRAIGSLGIGIDKSIASKQEVDSKSGATVETETGDGSLIGVVAEGKPPVDLQLRQTPQGPSAGFKLTQGRSGLQVLATGPLADTLQVWGKVEMIPWSKDGKDMPPFRRLILERIATPDFILPAAITDSPVKPEAVPEPLFPPDEAEQAAILAREMAESNEEDAAGYPA
jgi:hypothetical protein